MGAELVRKEFELFLKKHAPDANIDDVDEIVLSYISEVLGDLGEGDEGSFDVDQFSEMVSAYVPEFSTIQCSVVCQWVFELADKQRKHTLAQFHNPKSTPESDKCETTLTVKTATPDVCCTNEPQPQLARESPAGSSGGRDVLLLREMFPDATEEELSSVLSRCEGNVEEAIQELLDDPESNVVRERRKGVEPTEQVQSDHSRTEVCGDRDVKELVLARYAFVDTDEDKVTHRPVLTKAEPKKLVRFRDGHVVSTKGERFSVLARKDAESEDMKKTYMNLKPLRKYRFH